jgi:hypothetical protein
MRVISKLHTVFVKVTKGTTLGTMSGPWWREVHDRWYSRNKESKKVKFLRFEFLRRTDEVFGIPQFLSTYRQHLVHQKPIFML